MRTTIVKQLPRQKCGSYFFTIAYKKDVIGSKVLHPATYRVFVEKRRLFRSIL